jgi:hypothetical protein
VVNRGEGQRTATILAAEAKKLEKQLYAEGEHHARTHARHTDTTHHNSRLFARLQARSSPCPFPLASKVRPTQSEPERRLRPKVWRGWPRPFINRRRAMPCRS